VGKLLAIRNAVKLRTGSSVDITEIKEFTPAVWAATTAKQNALACTA